jgi:thioredoxin:protein disulfide reductase
VNRQGIWDLGFGIRGWGLIRQIANPTSLQIPDLKSRQIPDPKSLQIPNPKSLIPIVVCGALLVASTASAQIRRPRAEVTPLVEHESVAAGAPLRAALKVALPEGLHTQSNKPRDPLLIPTELTIDAPATITVDEIVWPPSTDFVVAGQDKPLAVFEHEFAIGVALKVAANAPAGDITVPVKLRYQACDATICYAPATAQSQWTVKTGTAGARQHADVFDKIRFGTGEKPPAGAAAKPRTEDSQLRTPAPNTGDVLAQLADFDVLSTTGGYLGSSAFLEFVHNAEQGIKEKGLFEGRGPLAILLIVFLGGLALNLTPCVLPMIPINLAIIGAGAQAGSRARGFLLGSVYGGAMAVVYGVLGLIVILTAGTFGTINSSPWFNLGIAILFVILGLAMFDVLLIDFSSYSSRFTGSGSRGSFLLAFSMGAIAALLAGACVAPVVIQVVLFSSNLYATGTKIALALPFFLGIGMAIPWPIAGAGLAALPKPGMWMVRVKQAFGVLILATAAYYGYEAYGLFANRWVDATAVASSVEEKVKEGWTPSLAEGLAAARRDGKPVLIDMWATWCKNCLTMDKTTLEDASVKAALAGYVKVKFQAEDPDSPPAKPVMQRFDAVGLPTYVILRPKELRTQN